jgi:hypothetical protein
MTMSNETTSVTYYRHGDYWVAVAGGMPTDHVRVGYGQDQREARESMDTTPVQSCGRHPHNVALAWALRAGWFGSPAEGPITDMDGDEIDLEAR